MKRTVLLVLVLILLPALSLAEMTQKEILQDFATFVASYKEAYCFWTLKAKDHSVNWDEMLAEYLPRAKACKTKTDLIRIVTEMQTRLHDGHCGNKGLSVLMEELDTPIIPIGFVPGEDNKIFVAGVRPGTPVAESGVARGDELLTFAGKPVATLAREARSVYAASSEGQFWSIYARMCMIWSPLQGPKPPTCKMSVKKPDGTILELDLKWMHIPASGRPEAGDKAGDTKSGGGDRAPDTAPKEEKLPIEVKIFEEPNIAYMKIDSWINPANPADQFNEIFTKIKDTEGLILDLRGNGGGVGPWGILFCNYFLAKPDRKGNKPNDSWMERKMSETFFKVILSQATPEVLEQVFTEPEAMHYVMGKLGIKVDLPFVKKQFKNGRYVPFEIKILLNSQDAGVPAYDKPVVALTDGGCYSTTDICLKILEDFRRIKIVGTPNGAGSGSPIPFVLPNSKVTVMVPHARAYPPKGGMIEGRPCQPDHWSAITQKDLVEKSDTVFTTGLRVLMEEINEEKGVKAPPFEVSPEDLMATMLMNTLPAPKPYGTPEPVPDWMKGGLKGIKVDAEELRKLR